jgi:catechol 2,3-dioxygenase-like lactoylglutathione lyase family enzyme
MITAIRHVGLVVADLEKSLKFWCDTMGFVVSRQMEESGPYIDAMMGLNDVRVTTVKLLAPDGNLLELLFFHSHTDKPKWEGKPYSTGLTHLALTVQDLDETCRRLQQAGVNFPAEPQRSPDGLVKVIYATGPEGVLLELVEIVN